MKTLSVILLALSLSACGGSSESTPAPVEPVNPPVVEPTPEPTPPADCTIDCDVIITPIDTIVNPIDGTPIDYCEAFNICDVEGVPVEGGIDPIKMPIELDPIDVVIDPIDADCISVPVKVPDGDGFMAWLLDSCTGYPIDSDVKYLEYQTFPWDDVNNMVYQSTTVSKSLYATDNHGHAGYNSRFDFHMFSDEATQDQLSWKTTINDIFTELLIIRAASTSLSISHFKHGYVDDRIVCYISDAKQQCERGDGLLITRISSDIIDGIPKYSGDIKEDYSYIVWTYLKEALYL